MRSSKQKGRSRSRSASPRNSTSSASLRRRPSRSPSSEREGRLGYNSNKLYLAHGFGDRGGTKLPLHERFSQLNANKKLEAQRRKESEEKRERDLLDVARTKAARSEGNKKPAPAISPPANASVNKVSSAVSDPKLPVKKPLKVQKQGEPAVRVEKAHKTVEKPIAKGPVVERPISSRVEKAHAVSNFAGQSRGQGRGGYGTRARGRGYGR